MEIQNLLNKYRITQHELADFTGIPRNRIAKWIQGDKMPPKIADVKTLETAVNFFTNIQPEKVKSTIKNYRIFMGNIEQIKGLTPEQLGKNAQNLPSNKGTSHREITQFPNNKNNKTPEKSLIPYYDVNIIAGTNYLFDDGPANIPEYYLDIPEFYGCKAFPVYSDSMEPLISSGTTIFCRKIVDWNEVLEYGQIYAVQLNDHRRFIKYIRKCKDNNKFIMRSHNQEQYDDFEIPKKQISHVWLVEGWMRKKTQ